MTTPIADPVHEAARAGLPGDSTAVNHAAQIAQFLASHGITPVYAGNRVWTVATTTGLTGTEFFWINSATAGGWLPVYDTDQPFVMPAGVTAIGRITVAAQVAGTGADLQVTLYPDNGSGDPNLASPLASTTVPASHIAALSAAGSLAAAGPLAVSRYNTVLPGPGLSYPWTQPAVSINGAGTYAAPVTSGNWTLFIGGYDSTAATAIASVSAVQYLGSGAVSGAIQQPSLPQAAWYLCAAATSDAVIAAGGTNQASAHFANVWSASWDPSSGTLGAWSAQQPLPAANLNGAMVTWGSVVYVIGGSTDGTSANALATVWQATETNGQITAWTAGPSLPQAIIKPYAAVVGDWLIVAGGVGASGTTLSGTWYSAINSDGSLAGWQPGPDLQQAVYAFSPNWNLAVTDSAVIIVSGTTTGVSASSCTQVLAVSPDGPAPEWQLLDYGLNTFEVYQVSAYPSGAPGEWEIFGLQLTSYVSATLYPVPMISVPLPASGLTPGNTYHLLFRQSGGDALNNYVQIGELGAPTPPAPWLYSARGSGGPWSSHASRAVCVNVYDQTPGGLPYHLWSGSGARVVTFVQASVSGQLLGVLESTAFPSGAPETVLAAVTEVTYNSAGQPSGLVQIT